MSTIRVAPSILSADFSRMDRELEAIEAAGADLVHVDVMDGHFVPNLTFGAPVLRHFRRATRLPLDVHLMIEEPDRYLQDFREAGADWISVHVEAVTHLHGTLSRIRQLGAEPGLAVNPGTPLSAIEEVLPLCHHVLLMSVNPGFGGQSFIPESVGKARRLAAEVAERGLSTVIAMDGGIDPTTIREPVEAGVSVVIAGSAVFGKEDRTAAVAALRQACE